MAGKVVVSTLNNDTGVLATQNGMTGIAKAWVSYNGTAGTIRDSFNVGSVTKNGTGSYTVNFTTALPNANYSAVGMASNNNAACWIKNNQNQTTTSFAVVYQNASNTSFDDAFIQLAFFSS